MRLLLLLAACAPAPPPEPGEWRLRTIDGAPLGAPATLRLAPEAVSGRAPCNRYSAPVAQGRPPAFVIGPVGGTELACPALDAEVRFYEALAQVIERHEGPGTLTLSGPAHRLGFTR